jgi:hypothetical protein
MLGGREKKKASSPGRTRSKAASDSARNRKGGIKDRKSSTSTVGLINYCLAMVSMTIAAVGFSDDSKRPRVKGTINGAEGQGHHQRNSGTVPCRLGGINPTAKTSAGSRGHRTQCPLTTLRL